MLEILLHYYDTRVVHNDALLFVRKMDRYLAERCLTNL